MQSSPSSHHYFPYDPVLTQPSFCVLPPDMEQVYSLRGPKIPPFSCTKNYQDNAGLPCECVSYPPCQSKRESGLPPPFTKWCVRAVSVWIIDSLGVAVTSCSPRSCLRKSSMTSPARVNRIQIKTRQNWNTTVGLGNVSTTDRDRWCQTSCTRLSVCANKKKIKDWVYFQHRKKDDAVWLWDMLARLWRTVFDHLPGTESTRDCSYHNPPRWLRGHTQPTTFTYLIF